MNTNTDILLASLDKPMLIDDARFKELVAVINDLIKNDFPALIQVLYRVDVSEKKLKQALAENPQENAGKIIAHMLIQRQIQKQETKKMFSDNRDDAGEERW